MSSTWSLLSITGKYLQNIQITKTLPALRRPELPLILYKACLDPWDDFAIPLMRVMPLNQLVLYICDLVIICSNLFLYRFLKQNTINNSGKSVQGSLLSLVEVERGLALIGREIKSVEMF